MLYFLQETVARIADSSFSLLGSTIALALLAGGALLGYWCARFADAYVGALNMGKAPDADCATSALFATMEARASMAAWPAVLMAVCAGLVYFFEGFTFYFFGLSIAYAFLLVLALIDARTGLLPDALTLPLLWLGLATAWLGHGPGLSDAVAGAILGYGSLWSMCSLFRWLCQREGMGYGDFKLLAALGAWLGWQPLAGVLLGACVGAVVFAMAHQRSLRPRGAYPFGPFLAICAAPALLINSAVQSGF